MSSNAKASAYMAKRSNPRALNHDNRSNDSANPIPKSSFKLTEPGKPTRLHIFALIHDHIHPKPDEDERRAGKRLADVLAKTYDGPNAKTYGGDDLTCFWYTVYEMVRQIPAGHVWHGVLSHANADLFHRPRIPGLPSTRMWKISNGAGMVLDYEWYSPVGTGGPGETPNRINDSPAVLEGWKSTNHFLVRFRTACDKEGFALPDGMTIDAIRCGLESVPRRGPVMDVRLWCAAEWIKGTAGKLKGWERSDYDDDFDVHCGELCPRDWHENRVTKERWDFWLQRLRKLASEGTRLGLARETVELLGETAGVMERTKPVRYTIR